MIIRAIFISITILSPIYGDDSVVIRFLYVGQGDSTIITRKNTTVMVDAGPSKLILEHLKKYEISEIDRIYITHHHADHYGGCLEIVRKLKVGKIITTNSPHESKRYKRLINEIKRNNIQIEYSKASATKLDEIKLLIFPQPPPSKDENNNSIGIRLEYGNFSLVMTGDSERAERLWWANNYNIHKCDILKAAHHGSRNGIDGLWLRLLDPKLVIISCGRRNIYGHPHRETISLLENNRIGYYRTDYSGTVTVRAYKDGHYKVSTDLSAFKIYKN